MSHSRLLATRDDTVERDSTKLDRGLDRLAEQRDEGHGQAEPDQKHVSKDGGAEEEDVRKLEESGCRLLQ